MMSNAEAAAICAELGHNPKGILSVNEHKHRFYCGCGYHSTNRQTYQLAVQAGIHHMHQIANDTRKNGYVGKQAAAAG